MAGTALAFPYFKTKKAKTAHLVVSVFLLEVARKASGGTLKGTVSAQKALQGSEAETRELLGGKEENRVSP